MTKSRGATLLCGRGQIRVTERDLENPLIYPGGSLLGALRRLTSRSLQKQFGEGT